MIKKRTIFLKGLLTGLIYALLTCIVQVPIGNALCLLFTLPKDPMITSDMVPPLLLSLFVVGVVMAFFYYLYGYLFASTSKWKQGMKFGMFVFLSNYAPQVFFLDATKGLKALITGGFPVIQIELFDFIILIGTVLLMVRYMPYRSNEEKSNNRISWWKCFVCGGVFAISIFLFYEIILPLFGFANMATGLKVSSDNILFFYSVMLAGFVLTGVLVSCYAHKIEDIRKRGRFFIAYGALIWCTFALTMIPLGFGVLTTILFIIISLIAFIATRIVYFILIKASLSI